MPHDAGASWRAPRSSRLRATFPIFDAASICEIEVELYAKAILPELMLVLFLPLAIGGRQQFSCRCSRRSMVHWNPPRRKTAIETSKRLQTPRRSMSESDIQKLQSQKAVVVLPQLID